MFMWEQKKWKKKEREGERDARACNSMSFVYEKFRADFFMFYFCTKCGWLGGSQRLEIEFVWTGIVFFFWVASQATLSLSLFVLGLGRLWTLERDAIRIDWRARFLLMSLANNKQTEKKIQNKCDDEKRNVVCVAALTSIFINLKGS